MPSEQPRALRCAIYTRKSSEEGLEQSFNSLDAQREACAAYVLSQRHEGWTEVPTHYDDGGFSGGNMTRPALAALMRDIDAGLIDSVVVYKVDRLTRSLADFAKIVECFDAKKVSFVSVTQQFNTTTSMGRLTLNVLLSFAQFEREVTGERIRDKIAASKKKGMWMGGRVPMGYDVVDRKLVVNAAEAETIRFLFRRYLELGCVSKLKDELDTASIGSKVRVTKDGKRSGGLPYSRGALYELLQNRLFIGETNHKEHSYPGEHDGIVDSKLWEAVQASLRANTQGRRSGNGVKAPSLLVGKVFLDTGERLIPSHSVKGHKRYRYYVTEPTARRKVRVPAAELEKVVFERLHLLLSSPYELVEGLASKEGALRQEAIVNAAGQALSAIAERERMLIEALEQVVLNHDCCSLRLTRSLVYEQVLGVTTPDESISEPLVVTALTHVTRSRNGVRLVLQKEDGGSARESRICSSLVKAAARGRK